MEVLCSLWEIIPLGGNTTSFDFEWDATDLQISMIEFSPMAKKGHGVLYGWTHEVYCTCLHWVTWRRRDGTTAFDLETYTAKAG